ncbi:MAG: alpha-amylase family glycosyl hydrolase [Bacteroidales bacterium]
MKRRNLFIGLSALLLGVSCTPNVNIELNNRLSSVAAIEQDSTIIYLTDYFPAVQGLVIAAQSDSTLMVESNGDNSILVIDNEAPVLGVIDLVKGADVVSIVYQKAPLKLVSNDLKLFTLNPDSEKAIKVGFTKQPDKIVGMWQNEVIPSESISIVDGAIVVNIPAKASAMDRSYIRLYASLGDNLYSDILVPLTNGIAVSSVDEITRHDPHAQVLYSLMIDRFYNALPENDMPLNDPEVLPIADYMGGDIKGITEKVKSGFFTDLGISTIWMSPITQNPYDAWGLYPEPRTKFSGYHGYWPIYSTMIDKRFGTDAELRELLDEAHKRDINVILDYVANHLHIMSPVIKEHPDWITDSILPDGRRNFELWDDERLTTWFDVHIPSLDLSREDICDAMTDSALYWIENYDLDGFRHDATKHIPEGYWRMLTSKMVERTAPERKLYQIGETYGSPELIGLYVKNGMLDAQFDFNVYDRATWSFGAPDNQGNLKELAEELQRSHAMYGAHNTMGYITGNHDRPRFISLAGGSVKWDEDSKLAGWTRDITVGDSTSYDKLAMLKAFILTIPGVPCIYQGDEYGIPGGNDPDNRHMMVFDGYNEKEQRNRDAAAKLAKLRAESLPLIYGDIIPLVAEKDVMVFARVYAGDVVVVAFNKGTEAMTIDIELPEAIELSALNPIMGNGTSDGVKITVPALSYELYNI